MAYTDDRKTASSPRVLLFSHRNIYRPEVWRCAFNEFEHLVQDFDDVEVLAPTPSRWYQQGRRVAMRLGEHVSFPFNPGVTPTKLSRDYDLFLACIERPSELLNLASIGDWKKRCRRSVCWLVEFYVKDLPLFRSAIEILSRFDYVFFMFNSYEPFVQTANVGGGYLPAGIDAALFCPYPAPPRRFIDVLSIGRRSANTHQALLKLAREQQAHYVYDTINDLLAYDLAEHRFMMANMAKRSRYFITNPGKINATEETGGQVEFGYRYFEGAAAGTILIGEQPRNRQFPKVFDWPDAVIDLPWDSDAIADVIRDFDGQPERQQAARMNSILACLERHDWVYRWESILSNSGLAPTARFQERKARLRHLAELVRADASGAFDGAAVQSHRV